MEANDTSAPTSPLPGLQIHTSDFCMSHVSQIKQTFVPLISGSLLAIFKKQHIPFAFLLTDEIAFEEIGKLRREDKNSFTI
jgi:hypothetical protein